ncbi:hypothetical protein jhhlp_007241 [Lomentospora prolificans]|uniref:Sugar phosphate transporter domain-containing protein n=1 Tax=Lomentospora prolificans TaxID=41688 RepID=A0A2N3N242_9PEZI|nr:hypothetical protein jhhlp_007241 [Lomentospora prolificans]
MPPTSPPPFHPQSTLDELLADDLGSGHATSSSSQAAGATPSSSSSTRTHHKNQFHNQAARSGQGSSTIPENIEMDSIPAGHRRRRSSVLNGVAPFRTTRTRSQSQSNAALQDEPKISEEGHEGNSIGLGEFSDGSVSDEDLHDDEETGLTKRERDRRKWKKRRNTLLDQRVAPEKITDAERKEADQTVVKSSLINLGLIALWYIFSLSISLYNKWMFDQDRLNFQFPLFTTSAHMLIQFSLASLVLYFIPTLRPQNPQGSNMGRSRHEAEPRQPIMTKWFYLTRIAPCGAATGLDIGLGNTSLKFITLTFYTMCKSSALAFVLLFAFLFRLETLTLRLIAIIAVMTIGVVMMAFGEVKFHLGGFILIISAAFFSGFRWALTQILLLRNPATSNAFSSIFFLAPVMFITLFILGFLVEGFGPLIEGVLILQEEWGTFMAPAFLLFPGCIAFCMTASEFALLKRTSVVTLSIAGIFKEVVTISAAALVFEDRLTPINFVGLLTTMVAICAYNWFKIQKMRSEAQAEVHKHHIIDGSASTSPHSASDFENDENAEDAGLLRHGADNLDARTASPAHSEHRL